MQDYLYDGTFEGFLTCVYHHYYTEPASGICLKEEYQSSLLGGFQEVHTDLAKADRVYQAIQRKISYMDLRRIYKCFLSTVPGKEMILLRYIVLGFRTGPGISKLHGNSDVFAAQTIEKKINVETERMLQFVRFSVMQGNILYARIDPHPRRAPRQSQGRLPWQVVHHRFFRRRDPRRIRRRKRIPGSLAEIL